MKRSHDWSWKPDPMTAKLISKGNKLFTLEAIRERNNSMPKVRRDDLVPPSALQYPWEA